MEWELVDIQSGFEEAEEQEIKLQPLLDHGAAAAAAAAKSLQSCPTLSGPMDCSLLPRASVRNSAHGKGHEEWGLAYAKAWSSLRKPPVPEHQPQSQSLFYALTYTSDSTGGSPP